MKKHFKKIMAFALAAALVAVPAAASSMTVNAAEDDQGHQDMLNIFHETFGDNREGLNPDDYKNAPRYDSGCDGDNIDWHPEPEVTPVSNDSAPAVSASSEDQGHQDMLDIFHETFGDNRDGLNPDDYKDAPRYDSGCDGDNINWHPEPESNSGSVDGSYTQSQPGGTQESHHETSSNSGSTSDAGSASGSATNAKADTAAPAVDTKAVAPTVTSMATAAVPVTDEAVLAAFPGANVVASNGGAFVTIQALSADKQAFNVWYNGTLADVFYITNSKGKVVAIDSFTFVYDKETGKTYVDVTAKNGAKVLATDMQKGAFARLFGINGVKINGKLVEEFAPSMMP